MRCHTFAILCGTNPIPGYAGRGEAPGTWDEEENAQNKPNSSIADFGLRIADWGQTCRGPIMRNKANSRLRRGARPQGWETRGKCAKRSQFFDCGFRITDFGLGTDLPGADCAEQSQFPATPGARPQGWGTRDKGAKRTQCGAGAEEGARVAARPRRARRRQTKPISGGAERRAKAGRERSYGEWHIRWASAKQSQFPAVPGGQGHEGTWDDGRSCETKPIPGYAGRDGAGGTRVLYKQTQFLPLYRSARRSRG
jgi:hypothetical protein